MSIDSYKQTITNYSLDNCKRGNQGYERVLLQLFGLPGNGKSSFINSCNLLPLNEEVEWVTDYERNVDRLMEEDKKANYTDFVVPIFVHSVRNVIPRNEIASYKDFLKMASLLTGINPLVLLTHKSHGGLTAQEAAFKDMGADRIYAIENYTNEDHREMLGKHEAILKLLCQVLNEVDFCMKTKRDPKSERNDRMMMPRSDTLVNLALLLTYVKEVIEFTTESQFQAQREAHI